MPVLSESTPQRRAGDRRAVVIEGVEVGFCWIPPGRFLMGSPESEEGRYRDELLHAVRLTRGFWLAESPTTQELWEAVMEYNPSYFGGRRNFPVDNVCWNEVEYFIRKINEIYAVASRNFRLPTEAEWEYACRAGSTTPFNFGATLNGCKANCDGNFPYPKGTAVGEYNEETSEVMSYPANVWGLYDMHGNVWEWCNDRYGVYPSGATTNPKGPVGGSLRVLRGGCWKNSARFCRSANRDKSPPTERFCGFGFRLLMTDLE